MTTKSFLVVFFGVAFHVTMILLAGIWRSLRMARQQNAALLKRKDELQAELHESEDNYRQSFMTMPCGIAVVDTQGKINFVNTQATILFGYEREELLGMPVEQLLPEELRSRHAGHRGDYLKEMTVRKMGMGRDLSAKRKDGTFITLEIGLAPVVTSKSTSIMVTFIDVTARLEQEEKIRQLNTDLERRVAERTAELETTNRELESFNYVASHDLQEPLRTIASYTELLDQRYGDKLDEKGRKYAGYVTDGAKRMQGLINDLLALSRVGTEGRSFTQVDMTQVLREVVETLDRRIEETGAIVDVGELPVIEADRPQMAQLIQNLISNAIKFRGVEPPRIEVSAAQSDNIWTFSVKDNGIGIDPKFHDRIFKMFQRLHGLGAYPGSGIGLSIAKKIVERHNGKIWFESEPGNGTTFYFTILNK